MKDIAIIGMAGRFPEASNIQELRRNLMTGRDSVRPLSSERRSATTLAPGKAFMELGFIEDIDKFDHKFFNISKAEAEYMDPHQRILLEVVYETIESSGYSVDFFNGTNTAVFIGDTEQEYARLAERFDPTLITGNTNATTAGRISRFFNCRGNAAMVDTACSSSLLAVHMACNELIVEDATYALACGVRFILFPDEKHEIPDLGIMSGDGKTRSFSAKADGAGAGEAVGCVLLKPLDKALADKDIIYAIIKGSAANQDAQLSGSLTAPSSQAQSEVIRKAWEKGKIDPLTISYIEAHGSGTKLGDPIEIAGIDQAFKGLTNNKHFCAVASIKSNIGHTGGAAGISGLIKAVLSLQYKELYPSVHFDEPNPFIDFKHSVVYVNTAHKTWDAPYPRRAGVSSFGLSGTNCHILLEEAPVQPRENDVTDTFIFNFSAKSAPGLQAYMERFSAYLAQPDSAALQDISFTLNTGRKHYPHRIAVTASTKEELIQKIKSSTGSTRREATKKAIFLFSGDAAVSDQLLKNMADKQPALRKYMEACAAHYSVPNAAINRFVLQYALYRFMEEKGLVTEHLLGIGTGDLVVSVVLNEMPLQEAIRQCATDETAIPELSRKLIGLIERETAESRVLFMELGPAGCLSKGLLDLHYPDKEFLYDVAFIETSPLDIFQTLYLQQFPVDWEKYYSGSDGRKAALPAYHFEKTRCWLKEPLPQEHVTAYVTAENNPVPAIAPTKKSDRVKPETAGRENWSEMERKIAAIWTTVLKQEELSLEDDFFRLGGHSLLAATLISTIEEEFGIRLIFKDVFTFATIKALAKGVEELLASGTQEGSYQAIQPAAIQEYYPLSEAQRRLWLIQQTNENMTAYNLPSALLLEGALDPDRLEAAFNTICNRHESLRTSFHEKNAKPVQVVHPEVAFSIQKIAAGKDPGTIIATFLQPFDLTKAPLFRAGLAELGPNKYLLLFDMHHITSDGVSISILVAELAMLYNGSAPAALKIQYKDYAVWQQELFDNGSLAQQENFWLRQFSGGIPVLQLPTDKPRPSVQSFTGHKLFFDLPSGHIQGIQDLAAATGTTPFMLLLAVYNVLLYKYTNQEDIVVGSPIAGRSRNDLDNVVGMFVNTLVLRNRPAGNKSFTQFLEEVKENSLNAYEHQDYPFALLAEKLDLKKDPSRNPLFDVVFVLQNLEMPDIQLGDLSIAACPVYTGTAQFDLTMEIYQHPESWPVKLEYNTALFEEETILLLKERFLALLQDILSNPARTIGEYSFKIAEETMNEPNDLDFAFNF